jgi:putative tryptophan/tyrosine transport system substrate-binding protein
MRRREFIAGLGGAAAWPLAARVQQPVKPVIGFLDFFGRQPKSPAIDAFRMGLAEGGFIEGTNLSIEYRSARGNFRRLPSLSSDLVGHQVAVIVAVGARAQPLAPRLRPPRSRSSSTTSVIL